MSLRSLLKNKYLYILLIFIIMIIFGKNLDYSRQEIKEQQNQQTINNIRADRYTLASGSYSLALNHKYDINPGNAYRLDFSATAYPLDKNLPAGQTSIILQQRNGEGDYKQLGDAISIDRDGWGYQKHLYFTAISSDSELRLSRIDRTDTTRVEIGSPTLSGVGNPAIDQASIVRGTDVTPLITSNNPSGNQQIVTLNRKNQMVGQYFQASGSDLAEIRLSLKIIGNGGKGGYEVGIRSVDGDSSNYRVSSNIVAAGYFSTMQFSEFNIIDDIYSFPLAAKLKTGAIYYLYIANNSVEHNFLNSVVVVGSMTTDNALKATDNTSARVIGDINYQLVYINPVQFMGDPLLYNMSVKTIDSGQYIYQYAFSDQYYNTFDLFSSTLEHNKCLGNINERSKTDQNATLIYRFNFNRPPSNIYGSVSYINDNNGYQIFWSPDNANWQKITNQSLVSNNYTFSFSNPNFATIYLKVTSSDCESLLPQINNIELRALVSQ